MTLEFSSESEHERWLAAQSALPAGFSTSTVSFPFEAQEVGRSFSMNLNLIALDRPASSFAAVLTQNAFCGAPIVLAREVLKSEALGAIVINNKVSNVGVAGGVEAAREVCSALAHKLGLLPNQVLPASTGVIGWKLPVQQMVKNMSRLVEARQSESILPLARGIMTTDLYPKVRFARLGHGRIVGIAKGAGMVEPNMATMLAYVLTDVTIERTLLREITARVVAETFNAISVDSDQSTSDMLVVVSSNSKPAISAEQFEASLLQVCRALAVDVVRNAEGVHHVLEVRVAGASSRQLAKEVGKSVINSPLVQTAIAGNDPNVGRLLMAVGKAYDGAKEKPVAVKIALAGREIYRDGQFKVEQALDLELQNYLRSTELYSSKPPDERGRFIPPYKFPRHERCVEIDIDLGLGSEIFTVWGCDRTHEYITENAYYRS